MTTGDSIRHFAKSLRLPVFESYAEHLRPGMSVEEALVELMSLEQERRHDGLVARRIREAGLPNGKTIDTFKLVPSIPHMKEEQLRSLMTCRFMEEKKNVCALGGQGTGKTHLMAAVCRLAIQRGHTVKFVRVSDMVTMLSEASSEKRLGVMTKSLQKVDLLALDEFGYISFGIKKAQLLFDLIAKRNEEGGCVFVTSNFEFSKWTGFFGDPTMTRALVGKLAGNAVILNMNGEDYRIASKKT